MMRVVLGVDRNMQAVQARAAGGFGVEMQRLGKECVNRCSSFACRRPGGQRRQNHIAAGTANTVKP
jgi:hypothetical protein